MSLTFQSLCSGSSGNALLLKTNGTTLLIDSGFPSMRACRRSLGLTLFRIDGAVISHLHSDHIQYSSLRVLEDCRIPVYVYRGEIPTLSNRHFRESPFLDLKIRPYDERPFQVGDFSIQPFRVPHDGVRHTFGFEVSVRQKRTERKIVAATDFREWNGVVSRFENADFIYVESNHDPQLLRAFPNPRSHYHLSNEKCGSLLNRAFEKSNHAPCAVMLGHLSEIRNRPLLARKTVVNMLNGTPFQDVEVHVAPRYEPSQEIRIL